METSIGPRWHRATDITDRSKLEHEREAILQQNNIPWKKRKRREPH